jgi:hypothetical protein
MAVRPRDIPSSSDLLASLLSCKNKVFPRLTGEACRLTFPVPAFIPLKHFDLQHDVGRAIQYGYFGRRRLVGWQYFPVSQFSRERGDRS